MHVRILSTRLGFRDGMTMEEHRDTEDSTHMTISADGAGSSPRRGSGVAGTAVIVGGGIGGLATAIALRRQGVEVTVLEQAPQFGEVGAGIQLAPNATRILTRWGLMDELDQVAFHPRALVLRDALSGEVLTRQELGTAFLRRYGAPYVVLHRSDLLDILLAAAEDAGAELLTSRRVAEIHRHASGNTVVTTDGMSYEADVVIGADGLHSAVRAGIASDEPIGSGFVAFRGTVPFMEGHQADPDSVVAYLGPQCHLVQYRVRAGAELNQVAVFESPLLSARAGTPEGDEAVHELERAYADCAPAVRAALPYFGTTRYWPMYDREPIRTWVDGTVALMGDAAHPMLQYLAQGACQALGDAAALESQVALRAPVDRRVDQATWEGILQAYNAEREPLTSRVQRSARLWGQSWHVSGIGRTLRNELFSHGNAKHGAAFHYTDWVYGDAVRHAVRRPAPVAVR
jgi:salicylate hydroxylase